jgi:hypothetical protein
MIASFPAYQRNCKRARRVTNHSRAVNMSYKRMANREHRRFLNRITCAFARDPELFEGEDFGAPSMSNRDID